MQHSQLLPLQPYYGKATTDAPMHTSAPHAFLYVGSAVALVQFCVMQYDLQPCMPLCHVTRPSSGCPIGCQQVCTKA